MVSTTGTAIEDFVLLFDDSITGKPTPLVWRRRIVDLPVVYRSHRCCSR
ncbi:hypothetical protein [Porphyromonas gingivalis]|nr:hypothetical protein [Porphyromonas gingivalis]